MAVPPACDHRPGCTAARRGAAIRPRRSRRVYPACALRGNALRADDPAPAADRGGRRVSCSVGAHLGAMAFRGNAIAPKCAPTNRVSARYDGGMNQATDEKTEHTYPGDWLRKVQRGKGQCNVRERWRVQT